MVTAIPAGTDKSCGGFSWRVEHGDCSNKMANTFLFSALYEPKLKDNRIGEGTISLAYSGFPSFLSKLFFLFPFKEVEFIAFF